MISKRSGNGENNSEYILYQRTSLKSYLNKCSAVGTAADNLSTASLRSQRLNDN